MIGRLLANRWFYAAVVAGFTCMALVFAAITWRHTDPDPVPDLVVT